MDCTDLETNGNTIICQKCSTSRKHGYLRGLEFRSEWKCDKCGGTIDSSEATNIIREAYTDTMNLGKEKEHALKKIRLVVSLKIIILASVIF